MIAHAIFALLAEFAIRSTTMPRTEQMSDNEAPIEELLFPEPESRLPSSFSSRNVARSLRNGSASERDAIPTNDFLKQATKKRSRRTKQAKPNSGKNLFEDFENIEEYKGTWVLDDEKESKLMAGKDAEDRLTKEELVEMLQEDAEEMKDFVVDDDEIDEGSGGEEVLQEIDEFLDEVASSSSDDEEQKSEEEEGSDDDECSWDSEENEDDIDDLLCDSEDEESNHSSFTLKPWTVLDFASNSVKETFMRTTTKELFSWTKDRKDLTYWLMSKSLVHPSDKGFEIYSKYRKRNERVGKDTLQTDFEDLKILCRSLERDVAATITNASRSARASRRANGTKEARTVSKNKKKRTAKKGPKQAKDICISFEEVMLEILRIQRRDFECEKEDRNVQTHKRPYNEGPNMKAALAESVWISHDAVHLHSSVVAINAYQNYRYAMLKALFDDDLALVSQFEIATRYVFTPNKKDQNESYLLKLFQDSDENVPSYTKLILAEDVSFYRALLNFTFLPLTAKMLMVSVSTPKGRKMCQAASSSSQLDLGIIKLANVSDITKSIIAQTQQLHALAFPKDPEGHKHLSLLTVDSVQEIVQVSDDDEK